jgi:hypothetical protein
VRLLVVLSIVLLLAEGLATAHTGSSSYAEISLDEQDIGIALQISHADWLPVVDLDADHDGLLTRDEVLAKLPLLGTYVRSRLRVIADGRPCTGQAVDADSGGGFDRTLTLVRMSYHCPAPIRAVTITSALFAREHPGHRTFAIVRDATSATGVRQHVFGPGSETLELVLDWRGKGRGQATVEFFRLGVLHIFTRVDQLLVLLGLLLVAAGARDVVKIAAAFTVAYTATLALAALGVVTVDGRLLAGGTALTIALVGLVNLVLPGYAGRWQLAFACGLVYGFGFANLLGELRVAPAALGMSLAAFNAGIEIGLLVAVCLLYPPIAWLGAQRWGARAVRGTSAAIALAGIYLLIERALLST